MGLEERERFVYEFLVGERLQQQLHLHIREGSFGDRERERGGDRHCQDSKPFPSHSNVVAALWSLLRKDGTTLRFCVLITRHDFFLLID